MKVENDIRPQLNIKQLKPNTKQNTSFTGFNPTAVLNFLDTSPAWGACAVDLGFMVTPRTITDFGRGADAGFETMRREGMGTTNHSSVGLYGALAGLALATGINRTYGLNNGIKANSIFADSETLDMHARIYDKNLKAIGTNTLKGYLEETFRNYEAQKADGTWLKFKEEDIKNAANILEREISSDRNSLSKEAKQALRTMLVSSTGVENGIRIVAEEGKKPHTSRYTVNYVIENAYKLGKVFTKDKVKEAFNNSVDVAQNAFVKSLKVMNRNRSLIGVGIASLVGVSTQPINMYLTKKKTGKSGFVGGGEEDKSAKFKAKKATAAGLFGAGVLATIGNPKNLVKDLQFKGFTPTIKQFKFIYGITIMSRFLAARNDNELKEATIKDTLGFANWLILGNFVQKLVAQGMDKTLLKRNGKGVINWITNSSLKTREEILHSALGKNVFKEGKALSFIEMLKAVPKGSSAAKQLKILTIAQLAGYVYSGIVLGTGIPKLNIYLTKRRMAKQQANEQNKNQDMLGDKNRAFLTQKNFTGNSFANIKAAS
jgi:hypothetical protein